MLEERLQQKFDRWYSTDHLPSAMSAFKAERAWRFWSTVDAGVHYAVYQFAGRTEFDTAMPGEALKALIADFDKTGPPASPRTRDILSLAEERSA